MRGLLLAVTLLCAAFVSSDAKAQKVSIEIAPAVARHEPALAALIRRTLPRAIQKQVAGKYKGALRVRIHDAKLPRHAGFGIAERNDFLDGVVTVPGRDPIPIRLTLPFDRSMFAYSLQGETLRARNLVDVFAQWVGKYI